ncbi:MAG: ParB/RepB/Spo0J family partition protein [Rhodobacteraceae bacterium]|nr:ParB/RepB/Spo0J family partition protein [Paracoccaceae bacterium]
MQQDGRNSLGRGLSTLLGAETAAGGKAQERQAPIETLRPYPEQPRREFAESALRELAASISDKGIIQPLIVRPDPERAGGFLIVAGERRWRAAQLAQLHEVPVIIRELTDAESLEIALIENIQREDLNPMEEAQAYRQLMEGFDHTQEQLSAALGKSRSHIANLLRLLKLPGEVQQFVRSGELSAAHARALVVAPDPMSAARQVVNLRLSVRQTEEMVRRALAGDTRAKRPPKDADTRTLEADLTSALRAKVSIDMSNRGESGKLVVGFKNLGHLDRLAELLRTAGTAEPREE